MPHVLYADRPSAASNCGNVPNYQRGSQYFRHFAYGKALPRVLFAVDNDDVDIMSKGSTGPSNDWSSSLYHPSQVVPYFDTPSISPSSASQSSSPSTASSSIIEHKNASVSVLSPLSSLSSNVASVSDKFQTSAASIGWNGRQLFMVIEIDSLCERQSLFITSLIAWINQWYPTCRVLQCYIYNRLSTFATDASLQVRAARTMSQLATLPGGRCLIDTAHLVSLWHDYDFTQPPSPILKTPPNPAFGADMGGSDSRGTYTFRGLPHESLYLGNTTSSLPPSQIQCTTNSNNC
jgi:hypothetical protein